MKSLAHVATILTILAGSGAALAAGGGDVGDLRGSAPVDPSVLAAQGRFAALERREWLRAEALLAETVRENPGNAEAHNLYAFSIRKGPNPRMDVVFRHYNEALRLRPTHRGAHEYWGRLT
jgi:hypothetical protein